MPEPNALATLIGRMNVGDLARHLEMSVEEVVAAIVGPEGVVTTKVAAGPTDPSGRRGKKASSATAAKAPKRSTSPSASAGGREPTRKQIHHAIDRWLIGEAIEQEDGNISRVAKRLETTRSQVRKRWAQVHMLSLDEMDLRLGRMRGLSAPPTVDELRALGTFRAIHEAVDRWLVPQVIEQEAGNVSQVAKRLGTSRRLVRELRDRLA
ncbi:MAG: helix-turn-helix domain-containing protein [Nannocystaceae bacterium]